MPQYTPTEAATLLTATLAPPLVLRVEMALIRVAQGKYAAGTAQDRAYINRIVTNPAGESNAALPVAVGIVNTVNAPAGAPTDAELVATVTSLWAVLSGQ